MKREERLARKSETSEKSIESYLCRRVKEAGGIALKFASATQTGYPDRVCLFPNGVTIWVELKGEGGKLTRLQATRINALRRIGHCAAVCASPGEVDRVVKLSGVPVLAKCAYGLVTGNEEGSEGGHGV